MASNNFINECKTPAYEDRLGKIVIDGIEYNQANNLTNLEIENSIYNNGTIIGNTYTKSLKFSLINVDKDTEFVSKIANPSVGVKYDNNTTEYIDFDDYTIESLNDEQTKNFTDITGYDSLNTMDKIYECGLSEGPHTVGEYWQDLLNNLGLETETSSFTNSDIVIPANPFVNNESNSVVLGEIEKVSCNFSRIEKRTRTVNNQEETYHVINLMWFNDDKGETATIDGGGVINNVDRLDKMKLIGNTVQNGTPTPESPIEVQNVTGRQVITVCEKNLLGLVDGTYNYNNTTKTWIVEDEEITFNSTDVTYQGGALLLLKSVTGRWASSGIEDKHFTTNGGNYTFSIYRNGSIANVKEGINNPIILYVFVYKNDGTNRNVPIVINKSGDTSINTYTLTLANDEHIGEMSLYSQYVECSDVKFKIQVEEGSQSSAYEKYQGNDYEINLGKNLLDVSTITNSFLNINNGTTSSNTNWRTSDFIPITPNTTYTLSWTSDNSYFQANVVYYNDSNTYISGQSLNKNNAYSNTFTTPNNTQYVRIAYSVNVSGNPVTRDNIQLEKGSQPSSYSPYKTPINLCGIGNYKDYIDRTIGKNKFTDTLRQGVTVYNTGVWNNSNTRITSTDWITLKAGTYTISAKTNSTNILQVSNITFDTNGEFYNISGVSGIWKNLPFTFTTPIDLNWKCNLCFSNSATINPDSVYDIQVEKGSQATQFEPAFGDNKWYIHKEIGNFTYNNEGSVSTPATNYYNINGLGNQGWLLSLNTKFYLSNKYEAVEELSTDTNFRTETANMDYAFGIHTNGTTIRFKDTRGLSGANFKTDLIGTVFHFALATPTNIEIEDNELISQLNDIRLISGTSHIRLSGDVTPTLEVNYFDNTPNYEFITSDYSDLEGSLTEYGPVNCVTLGSEDIGGENVFLQDEASIEENGETNLLINAEYFLYTQTLRQQAIGAIYNKLLGFRYYDLSLTTFYGKPFLQVGDKIRVNTNEGNVYDTYILKHTFTYNGTFKSVIESPSFTKQEEIVKSTESISSKIKRTEVMVDKANGQITSLTTRTDNLEQNTYTKTQTNELIQTAQTGLTNTFSEAGGNNIFRNTGLWFATSDSNNPYEFWEGVVLKRKEEKASNMSALLLQNNNLIQEQLVPNGSYTISFKYNRMIQLAVAKVYINDVEYSLSGVEETEFIQIVQVNSQHINIRFTCDRDSGFEIYDLMVNAGEVKLAYSQNQNETTTDTVNISKGITITSSDIDVTFKANADGIRTIDKNSNVLTQFTDTGMTTKRAVIEEKSEIVGTLWQEVGEQTWITKL